MASLAPRLAAVYNVVLIGSTSRSHRPYVCSGNFFFFAILACTLIGGMYSF